MPRIGYIDYCRKCKKSIPVHFAETECPNCGISKPVKPLTITEEITNTVAGLGLIFGGTFLFGLVILIGIIFIVFLFNVLN
jgi:hypothetical protein